MTKDEYDAAVDRCCQIAGGSFIWNERFRTALRANGLILMPPGWRDPDGLERDFCAPEAYGEMSGWEPLSVIAPRDTMGRAAQHKKLESKTERLTNAARAFRELAIEVWDFNEALRAFTTKQTHEDIDRRIAALRAKSERRQQSDHFFWLAFTLKG